MGTPWETIIPSAMHPLMTYCCLHHSIILPLLMPPGLTPFSPRERQSAIAGCLNDFAKFVPIVSDVIYFYVKQPLIACKH